MSRLIVFDKPTADALRSRWGLQPELHTHPGEQDHILPMVLQSRAAVAVGPAGRPGKALLLRAIRPQRAPMPAAKPAANLAPAGFLGLTDSIDMDSDSDSERGKPKKWWRKILD